MVCLIMKITFGVAIQTSQSKGVFVTGSTRAPTVNQVKYRLAV